MALIRGANFQFFVEETLYFGSLLASQMTDMALPSHNFAVARHMEASLGTFMRLELWHPLAHFQFQLMTFDPEPSSGWTVPEPE